MRRSSLLGLATVLALAGVAGATENVVTKVTARADGAKTVIVVHGSATPSFTAYRLERPARVVVDVADGKVAADELRGGPVDVDTWAVGQIAMAQYADDASRTARLMIGFKRPSSYDVKAVGHDLVITVTANEPMPAEAARVDAAKLDEARKRRLQAEVQTAATEERRQKAEQAEQAAVARATEAQREADAARARALAARDELERVTAARKAEEQRLGQVRAQASTETAQGQAERERVLREQQAEEARLVALRAEAQTLARQRDAEAKKLADTQAAARKAAEERQARLVDVVEAARARQAASVAAQQAEERRAQARAEEAARLQQAAQAAAQARSDEERARSSEAASREAENRAKQAMMRAQAAEAAARAEQARLEKMKADAAAQANAQAQAQAEVERARAELQKLTAAQAAERARAEAARRDAAELAAERAQAVERAQHAAALASGSLTKIAQAEREARRIADERAKESARLDAVRKETQAAADARARELARVDQARAEAQKIAEQRRAEEARLSAVSTQLQQTSTQLQQTSTQLAQKSTQLQQANDALTRKNDELTRTSSQLEQASDQLSRLAADEKAERARLAQAKADAARAQAELKKLDAERRAAAQAAEAQSSDARARIEAERTALQQKLAAAQAEVARATAEQHKKVQERAQLDAELKAARAELARLQKATQERLAMVPTPARMATVPATVPARKTKDALPVEKVAARVRDVRFADDGDAERVIVDVGGSAEAEVVRADERGAVLKIARADLPKKLERTLDASAFKGPIRSVSTYADSEDPGAVRVEVALAGGEPHAPPRLVRDNGTLTWEFPRSGTGTRSLPPPKMAPYGVSLPLQVAAAAPRGGRARRSYTGKRITLDLKDADIGNVLRLIADVGQVNMVVADNVKGTVTMSLKDVPWDQALDIILKSKGLGSVREGNVIRVAPETVLAKEVEEELARQKAAVELKPVETRLIGLSYADATQVLPRVSELLSPRGRASVDSRTNTLIITDVAANIGLAEDLVRNLDTQTPQVLIEARIVEARSTFLREVGIQWGGNTINSAATGNPTGIVFPSTVGVAGGATDNITNVQGLQLGSSGATSPNYAVNLPAPVGTGSGGALGLTLGSLNGNVNINLRLSSLENTGNVRIISAPKIMTLDNIEASIQQGVSIPISVVSAAGANTVFVDAKLNLTVKPHVTNEGSIVMNVHITRNEPDFVNTGARGDPTILKKEAKTEMLVRDGDTAVIGGIYTRNTGLSYSKVPWFADIPILGWLFKNKRENDDRTELLIFITPRIVNRAVVAR